MGIGLKNRLAVGATPVPDVFIDTYMAGASGEYVKVYLYLLRHQQEEVSIGQIADALNHTEADVQRALAYWQRAGVLGTEVGEEAQRSFPETPGQQISPVFASTESLAGAGSFAPSAKTAAREAAACDMSRLTSDESFKQLIYIAQQYLNKLLTPTDCQILGNLYSNLGFSGELLEYLSTVCRTTTPACAIWKRWRSAGISAASRMWNRRKRAAGATRRVHSRLCGRWGFRTGARRRSRVNLSKNGSGSTVSRAS